MYIDWVTSMGQTGFNECLVQPSKQDWFALTKNNSSGWSQLRADSQIPRSPERAPDSDYGNSDTKHYSTATASRCGA